jgi:hypothetical protein
MSGENEAKSLDYGVFLADLESKRAALDQAIASIRSLMAAGALAVGSLESLPSLNGGPPTNVYSGTGEVPVGAFLGKSIPDAAKLCLQIVKRKMTTKEIAESLQRGGIETKGKSSFNAIVHSVLTRLSKTGKGIVKFEGSRWGLVEWLHPGLRSTQGKTEVRRPRKAKTKRQRPAHAPHSKARPAVIGKAVEGDDGHHPGKLWQRAVDLINKNPTEKFTAQQLSEKFGIHNRVISMTLAKPVREGLIKMPAPKTYTSAKFSA